MSVQLIERLRRQQIVPAIVGPTASGKTALALALAERLPVEIISMDSALIYRGMDIGTAKPSDEERSAVPHHLIDILDPVETWSASQFVEAVAALVPEIYGRGRLPLIVGGTMMYYNALVNGLAQLPESDPALRRQLQAQWAADPLALRRELERVDPVAAARIAPGDPQRTLRALEVYRLTGCPLSELQRDTRPATPYRFAACALLPQDRRRLHRAIAERFDAMLAAGFENEVRRLYARGDLSPDLPSIRSVGYRQMWGWLAGEYDRDTMVKKGVAATRQLAKRQITWLRKLPLQCELDPFRLSPGQQLARLMTMLEDLSSAHQTGNIGHDKTK